jgi:archaemetzincin
VARAVRILSPAGSPAGRRDGLVRLAAESFGVPVRLVHEPLDLERAYDGSRRQYNATALLAQVATRAGASGDMCLALVDVDLFVPVLTFVFGQAMLDGNAGIVSTYRLANPFYGLARDDALLDHRVGKEILHELGHMFGLLHCRHFECVMRSSTYVEEIDLKRAWFCPACAGRLAEKAGAA